MVLRLGALLAMAGLLVPAATSSARGAVQAGRASGPFVCSIPVVSVPAASDVKNDAFWAGQYHTALAYLMVEGQLHRDFEAEATFTLPRVPQNLWFYTNWVLLIPFGGKAFVQVNLLRWARYDFRNEIALTWALPDGRLTYRDTGLFVDDGPHQLAIAVKHSNVVFIVDGKPICTAPEKAFFTNPKQRLYYQIGTEASHPGDVVAGTVSRVMLKNDGDAKPYPYQVTCVYRGLGTSWEPEGRGRFRAEGVDDPTAPMMNFEGLHHGQPCIWSATPN